MQNSKHTIEYAAREADKVYMFGEQDKNIAFVKGYMKAIEETNAKELLEALIKVKCALDNSTEVDREYWSKIIDRTINKATK